MPYDLWKRYVLGELGLTEQLTVILLVAALAVGIHVAWRTLAERDTRLTVFFVIFCLGCVYFAGEEASWGQHWFRWGTPDDWAALNRQDETNLHNLEGSVGTLFNKLPRNIMTWAILIGGAILPLVRRARGRHYAPRSFAWWIMPRTTCVTAAFIAALATVPQRIALALTGSMPAAFDITSGEVKELMIALFLLIYISSVARRFHRAQSARRNA